MATAHLAAELAPGLGLDPRRAYLAGLLHDCARSLPPARLAGILEKYHGRFLDAQVLANPSLWHNPAGVYLAFHRYGVSSPDILRAIGRHSTGAPGMHLLDKLIYLSDYCEPLRGGEIKPLRDLAQRDFHEAFRRVVKAKLKFLCEHDIVPHPLSLALARELDIPLRAKSPVKRCATRPVVDKTVGGRRASAAG